MAKESVADIPNRGILRMTAQVQKEFDRMI